MGSKILFMSTRRKVFISQADDCWVIGGIQTFPALQWRKGMVLRF